MLFFWLVMFTCTPSCSSHPPCVCGCVCARNSGGQNSCASSIWTNCSMKGSKAVFTFGDIWKAGWKPSGPGSALHMNPCYMCLFLRFTALGNLLLTVCLFRMLAAIRMTSCECAKWWCERVYSSAVGWQTCLCIPCDSVTGKKWRVSAGDSFALLVKGYWTCCRQLHSCVIIPLHATTGAGESQYTRTLHERCCKGATPWKLYLTCILLWTDRM